MFLGNTPTTHTSTLKYENHRKPVQTSTKQKTKKKTCYVTTYVNLHAAVNKQQKTKNLHAAFVFSKLNSLNIKATILSSSRDCD